MKNLAWNADHPSLEFVLLDYSSPDHLASWVESELGDHLASGRVVYYRYDHAQFFSFSHSRNMGARLCRGEIICNVDADNFTGPGFARYIDEQMKDKDLLVGCDFEDGVFTPIVGDHGWTGRMAVRREAFLDAGGYDEDMVAWGYEDLDLYNRLGRRKYRCAPIDRRFLNCIEHENKERIAFTRVKEIGRDLGATKGTLLEHSRLSVEKIARGELVANRGRVGIGRVRQLASSEPVQLRPWRPVEPVRNDLREQNNKILERELANGITTMRGIPNILFLELTRRCNLACSMCRPGFMKDHALDMSEAVLRRIEEDLLPTARVVDLRGWGESLLRRDFLPIVERFAQPGVQLRVLAARSDINCMVGFYDYNTPLILEALREAGKLGQVKIVAFDEDPITLGGVKDGTILGTIVQQAYEWGYLSMTAMAKYVEGKKSVIPADGRIILPTRIIDKDNVDAYWTELKAMLCCLPTARELSR